MCMTIHDGVVLRVCRGVQLWQHPRKGQSMYKPLEEIAEEIAKEERERIVRLLTNLTHTQIRHAIWDKNKSVPWDIDYGDGSPWDNGFDDFFRDDKSVEFLIALIRGETA
jgi:hypothetical protein